MKDNNQQDELKHKLSEQQLEKIRLANEKRKQKTIKTRVQNRFARELEHL